MEPDKQKNPQNFCLKSNFTKKTASLQVVLCWALAFSRLIIGGKIHQQLFRSLTNRFNLNLLSEKLQNTRRLKPLNCDDLLLVLSHLIPKWIFLSFRTVCRIKKAIWTNHLGLWFTTFWQTVRSLKQTVDELIMKTTVGCSVYFRKNFKPLYLKFFSLYCSFFRVGKSTIIINITWNVLSLLQIFIWDSSKVCLLLLKLDTSSSRPRIAFDQSARKALLVLLPDQGLSLWTKTDCRAWFLRTEPR